MKIATMVEQCINSGVTLTVLDDGRLSFKGKTKLPIAMQLFEVAKRDRAAVVEALTALQRDRAEIEQWNRRVILANNPLAMTERAPTEPAPEPAPAVEPTADNNIVALPPIRNTTGKPALPPELWADGLATFAEAWQREGELCGQYATALGKDGAGFYVRCRGWQWANAE